MVAAHRRRRSAALSPVPDDEPKPPANGPGGPAGPGKGKNALVQVARYSELAFVLPAATFVGWLIGAGLDRWLHTQWLYLAGLLVGIAAGFVQLIRTVTSSEEK